MFQNSEPALKPSFFDDDGPLETFGFWTYTSVLRKFSDTKLIEGILFKKSTTANFCKSRYYVLFDDRLAYFKNGRNKVETAFCFLQNLRVEIINSVEKERDEKFGMRFIHNREYIELYARSSEIQDNWMGKLKNFCILNTYADQYTPVRFIEEGSYAKVYMARRNSDGMNFAVKTFEKRQLARISKSKEFLLNEITLMRRFNHESITKLYEVHESETHIYLVLELLQGGDLYYRVTEKGFYTEKAASALMKKLLEALDYLHSNGIIHRDIKPENLLLPDLHNDFDVKIADFGMATAVSQEELSFIRRCGTPGYFAKEILANQKYDQKVEIFSAGVTLYILLTEISPFDGKSSNELIANNTACKIDFDIAQMGNGISAEAIELLTKMLAKDPKTRLSARECLEHPWLVSNGVAELTTKVETKKDSLSSLEFGSSIENDGKSLEIYEDEAKEKNTIRCQNNFRLLSRVSNHSTQAPQSTTATKRTIAPQDNLLNLLHRDPTETKQNLTIVSESQKKREKEVQKNATKVKMNLRKLCS